jgi:hypothetical protein
MAVTQHRREVLSQGNGVVQRDTRVETADTAADSAEPTQNIAGRIIYYVAGVIIAILLMRFMLSLLGANRGNGFADLIYGLSYPFAAPFFGLFSYSAQYGVARFEFETLVAALVYGLVAWAIVKAIEIGGRRTDV